MRLQVHHPALERDRRGARQFQCLSLTRQLRIRLAELTFQGRIISRQRVNFQPQRLKLGALHRLTQGNRKEAQNDEHDE